MDRQPPGMELQAGNSACCRNHPALATEKNPHSSNVMLKAVTRMIPPPRGPALAPPRPTSKEIPRHEEQVVKQADVRTRPSWPPHKVRDHLRERRRELQRRDQLGSIIRGPAGLFALRPHRRMLRIALMLNRRSYHHCPDGECRWRPRGTAARC